MFDSDVDNWCKRRRGDDLNETLTNANAEATKNLRLAGSRSLNHLRPDNPRTASSSSSSRLIRCDAISKDPACNPEVRFINPAIYAKTLNNDEDEEQEVEIRVKVTSKDDRRVGSHGDYTGMTDMMTTLSINNDLAATSFVSQAGDQVSAQETYRCYSVNSPTRLSSCNSDVVRSKSVVSCRPSGRVERRCKIVDMADNDQLYSTNANDPEREQEEGYDISCRYTLNGHRILRMSSSSLSSIRMSDNRSNDGEVLKKITYSEWIRRKREAARQKKEAKELAEKKKQMEAERLARENKERELRERENFLKWAEKKKQEDEKKKAVIEEELKLQKQLKEFEDKTAIAKTILLRQWARKKQEEETARRRKEEMQQKQLKEKKQKRLEESTKAYENWRKMAKNKPKPATQGLLPHQKAKPAYVNPTPWQPIVDDTEDVEEVGLNERKAPIQAKINSWRQPEFYD